MIFSAYYDFIDLLSKIGNVLFEILIFVLVLGLIIGIHEFGHFLFAKKAKVLCREYAIGMGPRLWKKKKGETIYAIRAFPIGGFCAIAGEEVEPDPFEGLKEIKLYIVNGVIKGFYPEVNDDSFAYPVYNIVSYDIYDEKQTGDLFMEVEKDGETIKYAVDPQAVIYTKKDEMQIAPFNRTLGSKSKTARALVMFGGPLMNFLLAIVVYFIAGLFIGFNNMNANTVTSVESGNIAHEYSKAYSSIDKILELETENISRIYSTHLDKSKYKDISSWSVVLDFINEFKDKELDKLEGEQIIVTFRRDNYIQDNDKIVKLYSPSMGEMKIENWNDIQSFLDEFNNKKLCEYITITYYRDDNQKSIDALPFISINNMGFGSGWNYEVDGKVIVKAINTEFTDNRSNLCNNDELKLNDVIIKIENIDNPTWSDIRKVADEFVGNSDNDDENWIKMTVLRESNGVELKSEIKVKPYSKELMENQTALDGGSPESSSSTIDINPPKKFSIIKSIGYAFERTGSGFLAVFQTFKLLFGNTVSIKNLSGPVGIFTITSQALNVGFIYVVYLVGLLSVNIGLMNLLPIPALDGGRLVFIAYEAITKKKPNPKVETILITVTLILLLGLMVFVAYEDIISLFR